MPDDLADSIVRVLDPRGVSAGTGFAVGTEGLVATCAHVVLAARGGPGGGIDLGWREAVLRGTVVPEFWSGREVDDVAVLRVEPWPGELRPVPLASSAGTEGAEVETWGFPDASARYGLRARGVVTGTVLEPDTGRPVLQVDRAGSATTGYSGGPVRDLATGHVIGMVHSITRPDRYARQGEIMLATPTEALREACELLRLVDVCPYRSLDVFEEEHARFLFGRGAFVEQMLDQLRRQPRFLTVLGPSGSGKSSVVRAGLLGAVAAGRLPRLAAYERVVTRPAETGELDRRLPGAGEDLAAAVSGRGQGVLLVLDQFEEVFLAPQERREAVLRQLGALLDGDAPVSVVVVIRDDFYSRLAGEAPDLMRWVERGLTNVPARLTAAELTDIVREPARAVRLRFEGGLVEAIVDDAVRADGGDPPEPGAGGPATAPSTVLPLLEFALAQLWRQRTDGELRWQPYRDVGRVTGALTSWADDAIRALPPDLLEVARSLFTSLVHLGNPRTGQPDSRRRRGLAELYRGPDQHPRLDAVLAAMTARRLLVTSTDGVGGAETVELIHDVLLREWGQLRRWLAADREFLTWRQQLEPWVEAWQADPSTDRLLRGADLAAARDHLSARGDDMDEPARRFVEHSARRWEAEQRERAAIERTLGEHQRVQVRTGLRDRADGIAKIVPAEPARALLQAVSLVSAALTALPAEEPPGPVRAVLRSALQRSRELIVLPTGGAVRAVAVAPDGRLIAAGGDDRAIRLWRPDGTPVTEPLTGHWDSVTALAFDPGGTRLVSAGEDGAVAVWARDGLRLEVRDGESAVRALAHTGDGRLAWADQAGAVRLEGETVSSSPQDPVTALAWLPGASWLAAGTLGGALHVLSGPPVPGAAGASHTASAHAGFVAALAAAPRGGMLASGGAGGELRLWSAESGTLEPLGMPWQAHQAAVTALAFSVEGDVLVSGSTDGSVRLWDVHTRRPAADPLLGHLDAVTSVAVSPDCTRIVSGGADRTVRVWLWREPADPGDGDAAPIETLFGAGSWDQHGMQVRAARRRHREHVYRIALSPDGRWVATASDDRTVVLSDVDGVLPSRSFTGHRGGLRSVAFSPDGRLLATASTDATVRLWDRRGTQLGAPLPLPGPGQAVAFTPDGSRLAAGAADGTVIVFDVDSRRPVASAVGRSPVTELRFHPTEPWLYAAGEDGLVSVWSAGGEPVAPPLAGHDGAVRALAVAPGGDLLATGGDDRTIRLWDRAGQPAGEPMTGHDDAVLDLAFTPDGSTVLSAGRDGTVRVWALDGTELGDPLTGHAPWATSVVVTPDGRHALSVGADGMLRTWQLGGWRDWLAEACRRLRRHPLLAEPASDGARAFCARVDQEGVR